MLTLFDIDGFTGDVSAGENVRPITVTVKDSTNNPLRDVVIYFERPSVHVDILPYRGVTDSEGEGFR